MSDSGGPPGHGGGGRHPQQQQQQPQHQLPLPNIGLSNSFTSTTSTSSSVSSTTSSSSSTSSTSVPHHPHHHHHHHHHPHQHHQHPPQQPQAPQQLPSLLLPLTTNSASSASPSPSPTPSLTTSTTAVTSHTKPSPSVTKQQQQQSTLMPTVTVTTSQQQQQQTSTTTGNLPYLGPQQTQSSSSPATSLHSPSQSHSSLMTQPQQPQQHLQSSNQSLSTTVSSTSSWNEPQFVGHGHFFTKKTFHKPTYCHHCTEMLWGLIGQGLVCEVCNFVSHEKCLKSVVSPCSSIAPSLIKNPVPHCWSEPGHFKRKFCNICRKRLEDNFAVRCEVCEYYVHVDCQVLAVNDCLETATFTPSLLDHAKSVTQHHHWREGNLPSNSKCVVCKKTCWTSECLAGMKCEWCGITTHSMCRVRLGDECNFGSLRDIIVPPYAVSVPRIDMNKEAILGIQTSKTKPRSNSSEWQSINELKSDPGSDNQQPTLPASTVNQPNTPTTSISSDPMKTAAAASNTQQALQQQQSTPSAGSASGANGPPASSTMTSGISGGSKKRDKNKANLGDEEEDNKEIIKVFDGNSTYRKNVYRTIAVPKNSNYQQILEASLRTFHINDDPHKYFITIPLPPSLSTSSSIYISSTPVSPDDSNQIEEINLEDINPIKSIKNLSLNSNTDVNEKPSIFLRYKDDESDQGLIRIYTNLTTQQHSGGASSGAPSSSFGVSFETLQISTSTTVSETIAQALARFKLADARPEIYSLVEVYMDHDLTERVLKRDECPLQVMRQLRRESLCNHRMLRFYLQLKEDPHGPSVALFVGNLPLSLSQIQYEKILMDTLRNNSDLRWYRFDVIYYEYGSMIILYDDSERAVKAYKLLKDAYYEGKQLTVLLLPTIQPRMIPNNVCSLLVFVNVKSGGQQGADLITSFRHLLNPHQVFDLQNGGPLPGLYVFRNIEQYRILACGGDGTIGWVLSCLDNVSQDAKCQSPPMAIVPLGTGNDLARVLRWGAGYTGTEEPINLLRDVIDAEEIMLDRWTVVFHSDENKEIEEMKRQLSIAVNVSQANTNEDNTEIYVMNNYFGIGIDADVCLDFHMAREENPTKFNSRLHNKKYYLQVGIRKMMKGACKDFNKHVTVEVDGKKLDLPPIEGIIILNILSWGSGSNPWGQEKDDQFSKPTHYDGMLEVVGIKGMVHMGQIQSGMSNAIRLAQGGRIKIRMNAEIPVQVDGEPWLQSPCAITILKSALKATMLKKSKAKMKRRNTEPTVTPPNSNIPIKGNESTDPAVDNDGDSEPF